MRLLLLGTAILLSGCAGIERKSPPESVIGTNKANFSVSSPSLTEKSSLFSFRNYTNWIKVDFYRGDSGCPWDKDKQANEQYLYSVEINKSEPVKSFEMPLSEEGNIIYAAINDSNGYTVCPQNIRFKAESETEYSLVVKGHFNPSSRCSASLRSKDGTGKDMPEPIAWSGPDSIFMGLYGYDAICKK